MSKQIRDTDYLYLTGMLRARENRLLDRERMNRMIDAKTTEEAAKVVEEAGYGTLSPFAAEVLERRIAGKRAQVMAELGRLAPDPRIVDVFRVKYDYHNAKVLIKAGMTGLDAEKLLSDAGRIPAKKMAEAFLQADYRLLPPALVAAVVEAKDTLARTNDPQLMDFVLDRAFYKEFLQLTEATGSKFLVDYGRLTADGANLRSAVRAVRMGRDAAFLRQALVDGGKVSVHRILAAVTAREPLAPLYGGSALQKAAQAGDEAIRGGRLTDFEKLCDNSLNAYLSSARRATFGEKPLIYYICAVESEFLAVRIVMTGRLSGLPAEAIRERLREFNV